jgi:hypothetical protein
MDPATAGCVEAIGQLVKKQIHRADAGVLQPRNNPSRFDLHPSGAALKRQLTRPEVCGKYGLTFRYIVRTNDKNDFQGD